MEQPRIPRTWWSLLVLSQIVAVYAWWFVCDDAYIGFRAARNLARGDGPVFNPGERVESFSGLLWVVLGAIVEAFSGSQPIWMPLLSAVCGLAVVGGTAYILQHRLQCSPMSAFAAVLPLALAPPLAVWSSSGLETMPAALLVLLTAEGLAFGHWRGAVAGALLVLLRVDGWLWLAMISGATLAGGAPSASVGRQAGAAATALVPLLAFRGLYFGELVPNVVRAQVVGFWSGLRGVRYVALFLVTTISPLLLTAGLPASWRQGGFARTAVALTIGTVALAVLAGGDALPYGRLLVPGLPFLSIAAGVAIERVRERFELHADQVLTIGALVAAVGVLPSLGVQVTPRFLTQALDVRASDPTVRTETEAWVGLIQAAARAERLGQAVRSVSRPEDAIVAIPGGLGALGFAADRFVYDPTGQVSRVVARTPPVRGARYASPGRDRLVPAGFFAKFGPRFLHQRIALGPLAPTQIQEALREWAIPQAHKANYVPDLYPLHRAQGRAFLLVVRLAEVGEDPAALWAQFPARWQALAAPMGR